MEGKNGIGTYIRKVILGDLEGFGALLENFGGFSHADIL